MDTCGKRGRSGGGREFTAEKPSSVEVLLIVSTLSASFYRRTSVVVVAATAATALKTEAGGKSSMGDNVSPSAAVDFLAGTAGGK